MQRSEIIRRQFSESYQSNFSRKHACWANNHRGWQKMKKKTHGRSRKNSGENWIEKWRLLRRMICMSVCRCFECGNDSGKWEEEMIRLKAHRMIMQQKNQYNN